MDLAVHMLTGKAYQWWQTTRSLLAAVRSITWECFHTAFYKQHFPSFRDELKAEYTIIEQGIDTIAEYVARFIRL